MRLTLGFGLILVALAVLAILRARALDAKLRQLTTGAVGQSRHRRGLLEETGREGVCGLALALEALGQALVLPRWRSGFHPPSAASLLHQFWVAVAVAVFTGVIGIGMIAITRH